MKSIEKKRCNFLADFFFEGREKNQKREKDRQREREIKNESDSERD